MKKIFIIVFALILLTSCTVYDESCLAWFSLYKVVSFKEIESDENFEEFMVYNDRGQYFINVNGRQMNFSKDNVIFYDESCNDASMNVNVAVYINSNYTKKTGYFHSAKEGDICFGRNGQIYECKCSSLYETEYVYDVDVDNDGFAERLQKPIEIKKFKRVDIGPIRHLGYINNDISDVKGDEITFKNEKYFWRSVYTEPKE